MRESKLMFLQYLTGLLILIFGTFHFLLLSYLAPTTNKVLYLYLGNTHQLIGGTLYYSTVKEIYTTLLWGAMFEAFLTVLVYHAFNGFRVILSEQFQGPRAEKIITYTMLVIALIIFIYGSRTIVVLLTGGG
jgi:succinate dehydrogenase hydrophobic anchor subunit